MNDLAVLILIVVLVILLILNSKYNNEYKVYRLKNRSSSTNSRKKNIGYSEEQSSSKNIDNGSSGEQSSSNDSSGEQSNSKDSSVEQSNSKDSSVEQSKSKKNKKSSTFNPRLIDKRSSSSANQNKVYDLSVASSNKGSSVTCTNDASSNIKAPQSGKDYYYLGDPKDTQVYHIFENVYTFDDAREECAKRSSSLSNPEQLLNAYNAGAGWCNWGWTNDGNAYLPSKTKQCNKDTGLLNGKNIDPYLRLGVNCYGVPTGPAKESSEPDESDESSTSSNSNNLS